ncbi:MAG: NCS2 family permease [Clostridiales bacterium]|nr:NCS2 family permease [Clostridiales bacterium]
MSDKSQTKFGKLVGLKPDTSIKTEIIAGITTFFAMCYIIFVNPDFLSGKSAHPAIFNAAYIGTIIAAVIGTLLYAFLAKKPFAQASGMGLNAFFMVSFMFAVGDPYVNYGAGLVIILISGLIFLLLSVTGLRSYIAKSLPDCLKKSIPAGIGLFIAFIGLQGAGISVDGATLVCLPDLRNWAVAGPVLAALLGLISIVIFNKVGTGWMKKASIVLGILVSTVLYYLFTWTLPEFELGQIGQSFQDFGQYGFSVFKPESWKVAFDGVTFGSIFSVIMLIVTFCLVDMFDTIGTLYGTCAQANMLDKNGDPEDIEKCMLCDSIATAAGSMVGVSTVTTFVESASGVAEGGRTGLTALTTAALFAICLVLSPIAGIIPGVATAPALIYVGLLMLKNFKAVDMEDLSSALPAFIALIVMPLTYSISNGIALGAISYVLIQLFTGKYSKKDIVVTVIAVLFILRYVLVPAM